MAQNKLNKPKVKAFFNRFAFRAVPLALLFALPAFSQTPHTESYQLGMRIQEGIQKGDLSAFTKAFDAEALANRTLSQLKLPEPIKDHLRRGMQPRATAESVAESVANFGRNGSFVGVRRFQDEYHLLFRYVAERDSLAYYGFVIGEVQLSRITLVDVYFFAPPGMLSDTIRRQCLLLLANVEKGQLENLEARQKDFIAPPSAPARRNSWPPSTPGGTFIQKTRPPKCSSAIITGIKTRTPRPWPPSDA
jgi:hypothetical protein